MKYPNISRQTFVHWTAEKLHRARNERKKEATDFPLPLLDVRKTPCLFVVLLVNLVDFFLEEFGKRRALEL